MKLEQVIGGLAVLLSGVVTVQADPTTTMDWEFSTSDNPATVTPDTSVNPFGATGTAAIDQSNGDGYQAGTLFEQYGQTGYGTQTGLWDLLNAGTMELSLDKQAAAGATLSYTLTVDAFFSSPLSFPNISDAMTFSLPNAQQVSRTQLNSGDKGAWYEVVYSWNQVNTSGPISLTLTSPAGLGATDLVIDRIQFSISGNLAPIPEPTVVQLGAVGFAALGLWSWRQRRQAKS